MPVVPLLARVCFAAVFILGGLNHFYDHAGAVAQARRRGIPWPRVAVTLSGLVLLLGGIGVLVGCCARESAAALAVFLLVSAVTMHAFWRAGTREEQASEQAHFFKNIALAGGALFIVYFGAGPLSVAP